MAALVRKPLKFVIFGGGIAGAGIYNGYRVRSVQAEEKVTESNVVKARELPLYSTNNEVDHLKDVVPREKDVFDEYIGVVRKTATDVITTVKGAYEIVDEKAQIGIAHTQATLDLIQANEDEYPRVGTIALAGLAGVVLGYKDSFFFRGGKFKKLVYGTLSATIAAALCYPQKAMDLGEAAVLEVKTQWDSLDLLGEQTKQVPQNVNLETEGDQAAVLNDDIAQEITHKSPKEDPGQANPEDKDMYSTRTS